MRQIHSSKNYFTFERNTILVKIQLYTDLLRKIFDTLVRNVYLMMKQNQREVIWVDPDDAELWVVGVVSGHVLQDLQELIAIWERKHRGT